MGGLSIWLAPSFESARPGAFGIDQDQGWFTIFATQPSRDHIRNFGGGLVGYTWEENGPALRVQCGRETLEQSVEKMASLPFVDVLYIRCDWRDVQSGPGKLSLSPVWDITFDAAKRHNLGVGFRIQLSSPNIQPQKLSMPDFLQDKVPIVNIGTNPGNTVPASISVSRVTILRNSRRRLQN